MTKRRSRSNSKIIDATIASLQALINRFNSMGPNSFEENMHRCLKDSYVLREEPEFTDVYFDPERTFTSPSVCRIACSRRTRAC